MKTDPIVQELVDSYGNWMQKESKRPCGGAAGMTRELYPYNSIFSPIQINRLTIKNRVVMAPMGNLDMCEETGRPSNKMIQYFLARAKGGVGLITTGLIPISHGIDPTVTEMGQLSYFPRIDRSRTVFAGWRDLAQGCHSYGNRIFIQLTAGLGRVGSPECLINSAKFPVSASINPNFYISAIPCMPISDGKLRRIIKNAGQAAADAQFAGIDGVYLHGHEGYLLEQLSNRAFNRRKLGKYADWQRFGVDMVRDIRHRAGPHFPIMYRIDLSLALNETYGEEGMQEKALKKFKNGRSIAETLDYMENLVKAGVDIFDVDLGCYDNWWLPHPPAGMPAGCFLDISKFAKEHFARKNIRSNAGIPVPIVAVGKLGYPDLAEQALRDGKCDMVMLGRPLLADPEWCSKAYRGEVEKIRPCIGCQEGCINEFVDGGHPQCAVNPRSGNEDILPERPAKPDLKKRIGVVGAGPAGMSFALEALKQGHQVELIEKTGELGGKMISGAVPKIKYDFGNYLQYLRNGIGAAKADKNFKLLLNTAADIPWLKGQNYDALVFANGTLNLEPRFEGAEKMRSLQATDLLVNPELLQNAKKVVIIGGGVVGCETAYCLRYEHGCEVTIVEMLPYLMDGACTANRAYLLYYMKKAGVTIHNCAKVLGFEQGGVKVNLNISKTKPNPYNCWQPILPKNIENPLAKKPGPENRNETIPADLAVFAMGGRADLAPFLEAQAAHAAPEIYNIGDSFAGGKVLEATRAAYNLACKI
ncbi:NAD(P)/FAD-dependent oxidoreductase [Treponema sp. TIM-1]|uniref:oxidoreductase n=1 Tax=Treponema sp. TIM-1 TaxID=2898417 RepID=UPI003980FFE9